MAYSLHDNSSLKMQTSPKRDYFAVSVQTAITRHWTNVGSMLARRLQRRANITPTLVQCLVFAGKAIWHGVCAHLSLNAYITQVWISMEKKRSTQISGVWLVEIARLSVIPAYFWHNGCQTVFVLSYVVTSFAYTLIVHLCYFYVFLYCT